MSDNRPSQPVLLWFHSSIQFVVVSLCVLWSWHPPVPNIAVLLLGGMAALMTLFDTPRRHKTVYIGLIVWLMAIETNAIKRDRIEASRAEACRRAEENNNFAAIGNSIQSNVQKVINDANAKFSTTLQRHNDELRAVLSVGSVQRLQVSKEDLLLSQTSLDSLPNDQLEQRAHDVARRMMAFERDYIREDERIDLPYWTKMTRGGASEEEIIDARREEGEALAQMRKKMEAGARPLVEAANRIRLAILPRLHGEQEPGEFDSERGSWFENPKPEKGGATFVEQMHAKAQYLDELARRLIENNE